MLPMTRVGLTLLSVLIGERDRFTLRIAIGRPGVIALAGDIGVERIAGVHM